MLLFRCVLSTLNSPRSFLLPQKESKHRHDTSWSNRLKKRTWLLKSLRMASSLPLLPPTFLLARRRARAELSVVLVLARWLVSPRTFCHEKYSCGWQTLSPIGATNLLWLLFCSCCLLAFLRTAEFDKVIFDPETELGQIVGPVQTQFGYHLIVVDKRTGI